MANIRLLVLVLAKKRSAYSSLAIYFPPHIQWWALKSPKSIISPLAFSIAILTLNYILI